jgi:hypothetical protein
MANWTAKVFDKVISADSVTLIVEFTDDTKPTPNTFTKSFPFQGNPGDNSLKDVVKAVIENRNNLEAFAGKLPDIGQQIL